MNTYVVILAAGRGTRMQTHKPKLLHILGGQSLLRHAVDKVAWAKELILVLGHQKESLLDDLKDYANFKFVLQLEQLGTGHALKLALEALSGAKAEDRVLVLNADLPLLEPESLKKLVDHTPNEALGLLTVPAGIPGFGRILRKQDKVKAIIEEKDANNAEKKLRESNVGVYLFNLGQLRKFINELKPNNAQQEYYLTDLIALYAAASLDIFTLEIALDEARGVNTLAELALVESLYCQKQAEYYMSMGVQIRDPKSFYFRSKAELVKIASDVIIDANVILEAELELGENVVLGQNVHLKNVKIGPNSKILANSIIENAVLGANVTIGPFARIRPNTQIADHAKVGNFIELKNTSLGSYSKANHFGYLGDAKIGSYVNIGAGSITCNYDGQNKHQTNIAEHSFIGAASILIAPINIGQYAATAAGTTVRSNIEPYTLVLNEKKDRILSQWQIKESET